MCINDSDDKNDVSLSLSTVAGWWKDLKGARRRLKKFISRCTPG